MKQFLLLLFSFSFIGIYAQNNEKNDSTSFPIDTLAPRSTLLRINDYAFIINEDSSYLLLIHRPIKR